MKAALLGAFAGTVAGRTLWHQLDGYTYEQWLVEHGAKWPGSREVFEANLAEIKSHNADSTKSWKKGVNQFTGLTRAEAKKAYRGVVANHPMRGTKQASADDLAALPPVSALPPSIDWRTKGVVTAVKDQGGCGGCWSFSAAETLESHIAIKTGKLMIFSEQAILSCTPNPDDCGGTGGCSGATQELAFNWTMTAGAQLESYWPYTGQTGKCNKAFQPVATITGYSTLPFNNATALLQAVVGVGPIAISAAAEAWSSYETGVYNDYADCGTDIDHAIVLEGYGHDNTANLDYWLVRNSWSASWGEEGYIRIARFDKEPCGTDKTPGDGDGCTGGPAQIQVCGMCGILSDSSYPIGGQLTKA